MENRASKKIEWRWGWLKPFPILRAPETEAWLYTLSIVAELRLFSVNGTDVSNGVVFRLVQYARFNFVDTSFSSFRL